ncbi:MAG: ornithine cyclodeaminase family protein [Burkholderiaceae bacterium]|nr:ornithine cyclodeaminase family protein [Burkholderiaceae bacterium]
MQTLDADATRARLPAAPLIDALRARFVRGCDMPPRAVHAVAQADGKPAGHLLLMPAWQPGALLGVKIVSVFPGNAAQGLPSVHGVYLLLDAATGVPLAQLDGSELTSRRTAAVSALAASYLARADATRLLIVGAGRIASLMAEAMACVRPIARVRVWNHRASGAQALAARLRDGGADAQAVPDLATAVHEADIVSCATLATQPLIQGVWLRPGTHVDLVGSFTPEMRETDSDCVRRARVFVDHEEALEKAGDLVQAASDGAFAPARLSGTLSQLCRGERTGRADAHEITLFKSVGSALQDLAGAQLAWSGTASGDR